jgi:glycerol-3-phosphate O-acyltransferase
MTAFVVALPIPARRASRPVHDSTNACRLHASRPRRSARASPIATAAPQQQQKDRLHVTAVGADSISISDGLTFSERATVYARDAVVPKHCIAVLLAWFDSYSEACTASNHIDADPATYTETMFSTLLELGRRHVETPTNFQPFHSCVRTPFDYYKFGLEFATVLVNTNTSRVLGQDNLQRARAQVAAGENVIFLANQQSEGDPYAIDVLFDWVAGLDREFCENLIFMAGDRVRDDPVVAPFSVGRNLLTVYSKKHINDIPELRGDKLKHNRRTIAVTHSLFNEGGKCIWFAPSGGRDRRSASSGRVEISPFDADAVEVMRVTAAKSSRPCHFYPMSLLTYDMLPPPESVGGSQLGEARTCSYAPMSMAVGAEIDWALAEPDTDSSSATDKIERRRVRAQYIEDIVREGYTLIGGDTH